MISLVSYDQIIMLSHKLRPFASYHKSSFPTGSSNHRTFSSRRQNQSGEGNDVRTKCQKHKLTKTKQFGKLSKSQKTKQKQKKTKTKQTATKPKTEITKRRIQKQKTKKQRQRKIR